jgi:hypothetical protein
VAAAGALLPRDEPPAGAPAGVRPLSPALRAGLAGGGAAGVLVPALLLLLAARAAALPGTPRPDSARVALVRAVEPPNLPAVGAWVRAWGRDDPEAALALAAWGGRSSRLPWFFLRLEADLLRARGEQARAAERYDRARRLEAEAMRYHPFETGAAAGPP